MKVVVVDAPEGSGPRSFVSHLVSEGHYANTGDAADRDQRIVMHHVRIGLEVVVRQAYVSDFALALAGQECGIPIRELNVPVGHVEADVPGDLNHG